MEYLGLSLASLGQSDRGAAPRTAPAGESAQDFAQAVELAAQPDAATAPPLVLPTPTSAPGLANGGLVQPAVAPPGPVAFDLAAQITPLGDGALAPLARPQPERILAAVPDRRGDVLATGPMDTGAPRPGPVPVPEPQTVGAAPRLAPEFDVGSVLSPELDVAPRLLPEPNAAPRLAPEFDVPPRLGPEPDAAPRLSVEPRVAPAPDRAVKDDPEPPADPLPISTAPSIPQPLPTGAGLSATPTAAPLTAPPPAAFEHATVGKQSLTSLAAVGRPTPVPGTVPAPPVADSTAPERQSIATDPIQATPKSIFVHHLNSLRPTPRLPDLGGAAPTEPAQTGAQTVALKPVLSASPPPTGVRADAPTPPPGQVPTLVPTPGPTQTGPQLWTDAPNPAPSPAPGQSTAPIQTQPQGQSRDPAPASVANWAPPQGRSSAITVPVDLRAVATASPRPAPILVPPDRHPGAAPGPNPTAEPGLITAQVSPPDRPTGITAKSAAEPSGPPTLLTARSVAVPGATTGSPPHAATQADAPPVGAPDVFSPPILAAGQAMARPTVPARSATGRPEDAVMPDTPPSAPQSPRIAREPVAPFGAGTPPAASTLPAPPRPGDVIAAPGALAKIAPDATQTAGPTPLPGQPQLDALRKPGGGPTSRMAPRDALISTDPTSPPPSATPPPPAATLTAATPTTPTPNAPGTPEFARHVTGQIAHAVADAPGRDHVALHLDPPELGRIDIGMDLRDQTLRVTISTERASTGDLIRRHADQLISDFADAGFSGVNLSFAGQNQARRDGPPQPLPQAMAPTPPQPDQPIDPLIAASLDRRSAVAPADSGIDLRL